MDGIKYATLIMAAQDFCSRYDASFSNIDRERLQRRRDEA